MVGFKKIICEICGKEEMVSNKRKLNYCNDLDCERMMKELKKKETRDRFNAKNKISSKPILEEKKANDIKIIDISGVSVLADYFIIASGSNRNQVQAMVDSVQEDLFKKAGVEAKQIEGYQSGNWILLDYSDIIVHVFDEENRLFYDLERIWRDGKDISVDEL